MFKGGAMSKTLNGDRVNEVFRACLFDDGEDTAGYIEVAGITLHVGFRPGRLRAHKTDIEAMLSELPGAFQENGGGGMSFLNACNDKNGAQWTGLHRRMEQLFMLGMAIKRVKCLLPRDMWANLPGGMPYYGIVNGEQSDVS